MFNDDYDGPERRKNVDWHLNKSVSLSVIILLLANIGMSIWWLAGLDNDVEALKAKPDLLERVIRLEAKSDEYQRIFQRLELTLDRIDKTLKEVSDEQKRREGIIKKIESNEFGGH